MTAGAKQQVHDFWNDASCGEALYLEGHSKADFEAQARKRYALEPYILSFADFASTRGKKVLEIGVGLGADHQKFAEAGAELHGIDLTERAVAHTQERFAAMGLRSELSVGDAERLAYPDATFDLVYSWGVLHHSPDTEAAIAEVHRVLKPGGVAKIMIYHKWSLIGLMLWVRYGLLRLRPFIGMRAIYANYLESPGTKAYSIGEAKRMLSAFQAVSATPVLTHGDLLESEAGQRHEGLLLDLARRCWPRGLLKAVAPKAGLFLLLEARR